MAACSPSSLLESGKCFQCLTKKELQIVICQLLCEIQAGGGTGGGGLAGTGSPEGVVTANPGATYLDTSNGFFYVKATGTGNTGWLAIVT